MKSKQFPEANSQIGGGDTGLGGIPIYVDPKHGKVTACFELTEAEVARIYATGEIYLRFNTGGMPFFPPITSSCLKERLIVRREVTEDDE
jgi:hypothetical protein